MVGEASTTHLLEGLRCAICEMVTHYNNNVSRPLPGGFYSRPEWLVGNGVSHAQNLAALSKANHT